MTNKFCLLTKVFISKTSDKPSLVRESFVDSVSYVEFGSLIKSLFFLYGSSSVVMFEISPVLDMTVR